MPAKSPVTYKADKLIQVPSKTTQKIMVESLGDLTDQFVAVLGQMDVDGLGAHAANFWVNTYTPDPRMTLK